MVTKLFQDLKEELNKGFTEKDHPFRFFTLGTVGLDKMARLRTVVLRNVAEDLTLTFYTDKRSKKIIHINENSKVSTLFYHPDKMMQLKIEGLATVIKDNHTLQNHWKNLNENSKKEYTTSLAPGSTLPDRNAIEYLSDEENYFSIVTIQPKK